MTYNEALSKLELEEGATSSEINSQYQEFYNEFQMRITNAPTEHQRKLYQKKLEELAAALEVLGGESSESNTQELPGIAESEVVETEKRVEPSVSNEAEMSKEKALQILGLSEKFTTKELENAFKSKVSSCETGRDNAISTSIRNAYEEAIIECNFAHNLLEDYIFIAPPIVKVAKPTPKVSKNSSTSKKKWLLPVSIVSGVIIVVILFFAFGNGSSNTDEPIDPATHDKYVSLKSQADLLAKQGNWVEALSKYNKAHTLDKTSDVNDSILSMKNHLLNAEREKEAESKRIKIGDVYEGGIVFKIDASGKHGLVCATKDQRGLYMFKEAKTSCQNLNLNGFSDWYLPSFDELILMCDNVGQGSSIGNVGGFVESGYWSSSEVGNSNAWQLNFNNGIKTSYNQWYEYSARAIRAF
jgi:hypothetical protein